MARILVSDGHDQVREFIQHVLTEAGHEVVAAVRSGGEALEHLGNAVDLLIAGRRCPDEKGDDEVVRRLCADGHPVPVIVAVSFPEALSLQPCPDCRLRVLSKPFTMEMLLDAVEELISRGHPPQTPPPSGRSVPPRHQGDRSKANGEAA